jgi:ribonuclease P protein component
MYFWNAMNKQGLVFKKRERLTHKKQIARVFEKGKTRVVYPVKVVYLETDSAVNDPVQVAFAIGRKNFPRAVDRNLLKRRMKEAYRLNKPEFYKNLENKKLAIVFIYIAKEILPYATIENSVRNLIHRMA